MFRRNELLALLNRADCYVSLHRSEGFGLNMADAMAIGKPVIATGYSGNMEFMNVNNSLPVKYTLKQITEEVPPYSVGSIWSEPDTNHAASLMQYAVANPAEIKILAESAKQDMKDRFSAEAIGKLIQKRTTIIKTKIKNRDIATELNLANAKIYVLEEKVKYLENTFYNKIRKKLKKK
jgi:glycosyltransferase involved in cell wall biosynthesis